MRDSVESTQRTLRPTAHRLELENLLEHFRHLNLLDDSDFFVPVETDRSDSPEDQLAVLLRLGLVTSRSSYTGSVYKVISGRIRIESVVPVIFDV